MDTNLLNNYVLKAIDAYPYELEETVENLNLTGEAVAEDLKLMIAIKFDVGIFRVGCKPT